MLKVLASRFELRSSGRLSDSLIGMKIGKLVISLWVVYFCSAASFATRPHPMSQLAFMAFGLCLLFFIPGSFLWALLTVRRNGVRAFVVPVLSVIILIGSFVVGLAARHVFFQWDLPRYEAAAKWVEQQPLPADSSYINLEPPSEFAGLAGAIHAKRTPECGTVVWFFWGFGFPVKHTVRIYSPEDSVVNRKCLGEWRTPRKLAEHWYEASD